MLAIFAAIKHFQHLLDGRSFIIKTDHKPLTFAFRQKLSKASERQLRQLDYISQFSTDIVYIKGEENVVADALSRICTIDMPTVLDAKTIQHQQEDEELQDLIQNPSSLLLQQLTIDTNKIYCDISSNIVRPYLKLFAKQPSISSMDYHIPAAEQHLESCEKNTSGLALRRTPSNGPENVYPVNEQKFIVTPEQSQNTSTYLTTDSIIFI